MLNKWLSVGYPQVCHVECSPYEAMVVVNHCVAREFSQERSVQFKICLCLFLSTYSFNARVR